MKSLDKTARFHVLYQNKGYDIVVKLVTALLALVRALTKKKKNCSPHEPFTSVIQHNSNGISLYIARKVEVLY